MERQLRLKEIAGLFTGVQVHEGENTLVFTFVPKGRNAGLLYYTCDIVNNCVMPCD